jgi:hypothetical protein
MLSDTDLDVIAEDFARDLVRTHGLDVADPATVRAALVPFLEAVVPGELTDAQRVGMSAEQAAERLRGR